MKKNGLGEGRQSLDRNETTPVLIVDTQSVKNTDTVEKQILSILYGLKPDL